MKYIKLYEKFNKSNYVEITEIKMQEISDLVSDLDNFQFSYEIDNYGLEARLVTSKGLTKFIMDFDPISLVRFVRGKQIQDEIKSLEEGLDIIERCVQKCIGVNENRK